MQAGRSGGRRPIWPKTLEAVRQFQRAHPPLVVDGVVGPLTWAEVHTMTDAPPTGEEATLAKKAFQRGAEAHDAGRFAHAYDEFTKAYELSPGRHRVLPGPGPPPAGRPQGEAIALFEQYLTMPEGTRHADATALDQRAPVLGAAP